MIKLPRTKDDLIVFGLEYASVTENSSLWEIFKNSLSEKDFKGGCSSKYFKQWVCDTLIRFPESYSFRVEDYYSIEGGPWCHFYICSVYLRCGRSGRPVELAKRIISERKKNENTQAS